jgi:SAM-dependent methyltransferase
LIKFNFLKLPHAKKGANIDEPDTNVLHGKIIKRKKFLREFYNANYSFFKEQSKNLPDGLRVELGSGGGYIKEFIPNTQTSDVLQIPGLDLYFSATDMPFPDHSLSALYMIDVLHHIPDVELFFKEADRCLKSGGKVIMVEPANTLWGRFIYRNFHHEPFDPNASSWKLPAGGPMSMANGALPWILFSRDRLQFEMKFPGLFIQTKDYDFPFIYLLSGGVSMRQLLPDCIYGFVRWVERFLFYSFRSKLGMFTKIVLVKK